MVAAGIQKHSLIDYPGKISCVVFLTGCNFTCPYCHNPKLARGVYPARISLDQLSNFIDQRRSLLEGVVITGGEPTLHPDLAVWCRAIRLKGMAVKLDTNGSRPEILSELLKAQLLDFIALDIKTDPAAYGSPLCHPQDAAAVSESIGLVMKSEQPYEFRTTCVRPFIDDAHIEAIGRTIQGARQWTLQTFHAADLLDPDYFGDTPAGYSPPEMNRLQQAAAPWVQRCTLR
jgi:pyruvate formate lyase activating enzyme